MSHLVKKNKFFYKLFWIFFFGIIFLILYKSLNNYRGDKFLYLIFSIIFNFYLFFSFRKKAIFFDKFLCVFLWLGFWFKFSCVVLFFNGKFNEVGDNIFYNIELYDKSLLFSSICELFIMISTLLREKLFTYSYNFNCNKNYFYIVNKNFLLFFFVSISLFICFINFNFQLYQKGMLPLYNINFLLFSLIKWFLLIGIPTISAIFIFFEINKKKNISVLYFFIIILPIFFSSLSMLSRDAIFNSSAILFGLYVMNKLYKLNLNIKFFFKSFFVLFFLFYTSVILVNFLRANYYYIGKSNINFVNDIKGSTSSGNNSNKTNQEKKFDDVESSTNEIFYLIVYRWVGINSVINILGNKEILSFQLFKKSFEEKAIEKTEVTEKTFYEKYFNFYDKNANPIKNNVKGNTLPGIIGFLLYSGSYFFVFFSLSFLCFLFSFFEILAFKISKNMLFSSLIGMLVAYRLIHFGYAPLNTYKIILGIVLAYFVSYFFITILSKKTK